MMHSPAATLALAVGRAEAKGLGSGKLEGEHVLLGVLKVADPSAVADELPNDPSARVEIGHLGAYLEGKAVPAKWMRRRLRYLIDKGQPSGGTFDGAQADSCKAVLARAEALAREAGDEEVRIVDLLAACLEADSAIQTSLFAEFGVDPEALRPGDDTRRELQARLAGEPQPDPGGSQPKAAQGAATQPGARTAPADASPLAEFGRDLTALARAGRLGPVVGRRAEIKLIAQVLLRMKKNNAVLLGDPGVGKTAVAEGLALYAAREDAREAVRGFHLVEVSMASLIAGTKYRGDFEGRLQKVIEESKRDPSLVVFVDEIHTMMGTGSGDGSMNAADVLKPALERGEIRMIGATTVKEYRKYFERDEALKRRFQPVWISEPSREETLEILRGLRPRLQAHHKLEIPDATMVAAVELAARFLVEGFFPDKAIVTLDQACASRRLLTISPTDEQQDVLEAEDVARVVATSTQVPLDVVAGWLGTQAAAGAETVAFDKERFRDLLTARVVGQDRAVEVLVNAVGRKRAGVTDPRVPVVVLFAGPSGTGKTELAKALAAALFQTDERLIRLDMTEFRESHSVAKIIGSPPGYVGYGEESPLVRDIRRFPYSVVLLDEIEKAHKDILTAFMPVFDEGRLTTADGKAVTFSDAILVLTSNLGIAGKPSDLGIVIQEQVTEQEREAMAAADLERAVKAAVRGHLLPELLNRIQDLVVFQPLSREAIHRILDLQVAKLNRQLADRRIAVSLDDDAKDLVMREGYSPVYGARELIRVLERRVSNPLAEAINAGTIRAGCTVIGHGPTTAEDGDLQFEVATDDTARTLTLPPRDSEQEEP